MTSEKPSDLPPLITLNMAKTILNRRQTTAYLTLHLIRRFYPLPPGPVPTGCFADYTGIPNQLTATRLRLSA